MSESYDDIIDLPHHEPTTRPRMPSANRAAQFSPFAALAGFESAIEETARLTDEQIELDDNGLAMLDMKLQQLTQMITTAAKCPKVTITYFQPDSRKEGGQYVTAVSTVKKVDHYTKTIKLASGEVIRVADITDIDW